MSEAATVGESRRRSRPHYEGDPSLFRVMRKPQWIGALVLALVVASVFAWLGQWQLDNAIRVDDEPVGASEIVRPLDEISAPGVAVSDGAAGVVVSTVGSFVPGDFMVVEGRSNGGEVGAWVVGHLESAVGSGEAAAPSHLAVAIGWAPDVAAAELAAQQLDGALERNIAESATNPVELEGRYMPTDGPQRPDAGDPVNRLLSMVPAQLVNLWQPFEGSSYAGYLVLHPGLGVAPGDFGLDPIDSVPPLPAEKINWVSLFYAIEWVVFAGFAVFFWYRLARDDWEKTHELQLLQAVEHVEAAETAA